jgi:putative ABC transport system ATP-binding protein
MSDEPLLRAAGLCKTYPDGQVQALRDVSLSLRRGEYAAVMGASGSGKSTLLNLLGALDRPTAGDIFFEGRLLSSLGSLDRFRAEKLGFVFQSFFLLPTLTAAENVQVPMFGGRRRPRQRAARALELLREVGMAHRAAHRPGQLSVGERQRVAIARALANDPVLLLADEPTGNLDSHTAAEVLDLFDRLHAERGMTLVVVTHGEDVARRAQRTLHMRDGRLLGCPEGIESDRAS